MYNDNKAMIDMDYVVSVINLIQIVRGLEIMIFYVHRFGVNSFKIFLKCFAISI